MNYVLNPLKKSKSPWSIRGALFLLLLLVSVTSLYTANYLSDRTIPDRVIKQAGFGIWYPNHSKSGYRIKSDSVTYDAATGIVSFEINNDGMPITFNQQSVPEHFSLMPDVYEGQVAGLQQVTRFESVNGTVAVTRPSDDGGTTAIMKSKGTLLIARANTELAAEQWKKIFNFLEFAQ